MLPGQKSEEMF